MEYTKNFLKETAVIVLLAMVIIFCVSGTVFCRYIRLDKSKELNYRAMEREYEREIRELLEEKGYRNSGVTMNSITEANGVRSYTVTIHHKKIEALNTMEKNALTAECQGIEIPVENSCINVTVQTN